MSGVSIEWIETDGALRDLLDRALEAPEYFLDTEFHRERTYYPQLALVQIKVGDRISLVDPLAVDPRELSVLLESDSLCVMHAAQQDLDVLSVACGTVPTKIYDTQVAASFLGMTAPSLANLVQQRLGLHLAKGDRLTDWLRRPLNDSQLRYAAADVDHLPAIADDQRRRLVERGRLGWVNDACEELRTRRPWPPQPEEAWQRVKELRSLRGPARSAAVELAAWRELEARRRDQPSRRVMSDVALAAVAQALPASEEELRGLRGLESARLGREERAALLECIAASRSKTPPEVVVVDDVEREQRAAVTLIIAWIAELAREHELDPTMLATRQDVVDLVRRRPDARLSHGWRAELVGRDVDRIVAGEVALAFDGAGRLRLVPIG